jgi:hypothetical protein
MALRVLQRHHQRIDNDVPEEAFMDYLQECAAGSLTRLGDHHGVLDEEVPLGWECANPALQIERWQEDAATLPERR